MISLFVNAIKIIFLLGILIFIHECGHFIVAKWCKVKVNEFSIGFGPIIWKKKGKETEYAIRAVPLGGFVNLLGEEEKVEDERAFNKVSILKRMAIMVAGSVVNIVFGIIIYFMLVAALGNYISTTIKTVEKDSAAEIFGLMPGDSIVKIDNKEIKLKSDIDLAVSNSEGKKLNITVQREDELLNIEIYPQKKEDRYYLGVTFNIAEKTFGNNMHYAFYDTIYFVSAIGDSLKQLFTGNVGINQLTGPVGISEMVTQTEKIKDFVYLLALISVSLGITNLLPFPPLDGGKVVLLLLEAVRRKPLSEKIEAKIQITGFFLLIGLSIIVTYNDVLRIF